MKDTCRFCAEPIEAQAEKCPHCGEALAEGRAQGALPAKPASKAVIVIVLAAALLMFVCLFGGIAAVAIPNLIEARKHGNEAAAIGALKTINVAQTLFREGDKERDQVLDYGTLQELSDNDLIDSVLGSGTKQGYLFQAAPSADDPEFLWMAVANPAAPGTTGDRYFAINHTGVIYYSSTTPFVLTPDCEMPPGALTVSR